MPTPMDGVTTTYAARQLRAWEICWRGLGARPRESIYEAARRARYHGHERAKASELLLTLPEDATSAQRWCAIFDAADILKLRLVGLESGT